MKKSALLLFATGTLASQTCLAQSGPSFCQPSASQFVVCVKPSEANPAVQRFDEPHFITFNRANDRPDAPLLLFLTGTGGKPPGPLEFLQTATTMGYRVITLAYNDVPAVAVYCPRRPDPACSANFRQMRIYGDGTTLDAAIDNTGPEAITARLSDLLKVLHTRYPDQQWSRYLADGKLQWQHIALAGQSQGAGMAAFIAKTKVVAKVILFSSPWDFQVKGPGKRQLAPWIALPNATPSARWFGGYHARENAADLLALSYAALQIPKDHVKVFDEDLPADGRRPQGDNPYHGQGIQNTRYASTWNLFLAPAVQPAPATP